MQKLHLEVRELPSPKNSRRWRSVPQVFDVSVGAESRVIGEIPPNMVRILVDHELIASPVPVRHDVVIEGGDVPIVIAEPEAFPVSSRKIEYVLRTEAAAEMSVCPRLSEVIMRIVGATIVSYPSIVLGVDVRNVRMALPVHFHVVLGRRFGLLTPVRRARRRRSPCGSRTARGNVSAANRGMTTAAAVGPAAVLPKSSRANENR